MRVALCNISSRGIMDKLIIIINKIEVHSHIFSQEKNNFNGPTGHTSPDIIMKL